LRRIELGRLRSASDFCEIQRPMGEIKETRFNYQKVAPVGFRAMLGLERYFHECGLELALIHLIKLRAS
jgi:hypothetical protein